MGNLIRVKQQFCPNLKKEDNFNFFDKTQENSFEHAWIKSLKKKQVSESKPKSHDDEFDDFAEL